MLSAYKRAIYKSMDDEVETKRAAKNFQNKKWVEEFIEMFFILIFFYFIRVDFLCCKINFTAAQLFHYHSHNIKVISSSHMKLPENIPTKILLHCCIIHYHNTCIYPHIRWRLSRGRFKVRIRTCDGYGHHLCVRSCCMFSTPKYISLTHFRWAEKIACNDELNSISCCDDYRVICEKE